MRSRGRPVGARPGGRCPGERPGFTYVEVLVAAAVLLVGFAGLVSIFYGGFSNVAEAGKGTAAVAAAESMLELIRTQATAQVPQFNGVTAADKTKCPTPPLKDPCEKWIDRVTGLPGGAGTVAVATTPGTIPFHTITVTVSWVEASRGGKRVTLVTGISQTNPPPGP